MKRKIVNGNSLKASSTNDSLELSHVKDDDDDDHDNNNFPKRNKFNNEFIGKKNEANLTDFTRYSSTNVPMVIDCNPTSTTTSQTESSTENISSTASSSVGVENRKSLYKRMMTFNITWNPSFQIP